MSALLFLDNFEGQLSGLEMGQCWWFSLTFQTSEHPCLLHGGKRWCQSVLFCHCLMCCAGAPALPVSLQEELAQAKPVSKSPA